MNQSKYPSKSLPEAIAKQETNIQTNISIFHFNNTLSRSHSVPENLNLIQRQFRFLLWPCSETTENKQLAFMAWIGRYKTKKEPASKKELKLKPSCLGFRFTFAVLNVTLSGQMCMKNSFRSLGSIPESFEIHCRKRKKKHNWPCKYNFT